MAMTVIAEMATGSGPTWTDLAGKTLAWNREDSIEGTTFPVPIPVGGTNYSFAKAITLNITATGGLTMSENDYCKAANETTTGTKVCGNSFATTSYHQSTKAPVTAGSPNSFLPLAEGWPQNMFSTALYPITNPFYYPGGTDRPTYSTTGRLDALVLFCLGLDTTCVTTGTVSTPTLRFIWNEG